MTKPSLFIIRTCQTGDTYRNTFATRWSFERLLQETRNSLETLAENIKNADYDHPVATEATAIVLRRIELCMALSPSDFKDGSTGTERSQLIIRRLKKLEKKAVPSGSTQETIKVA